jgi:hypothetical protein
MAVCLYQSSVERRHDNSTLHAVDSPNKTVEVWFAFFRLSPPTAVLAFGGWFATWQEFVVKAAFLARCNLPPEPFTVFVLGKNSTLLANLGDDVITMATANFLPA